MKILFVAKHACGDNDDEGAISHALRLLGHEVVEVQEHPSLRDIGFNLRATAKTCDLCLFLKWPDVVEIKSVAREIPCAYWHFDMIQSIEGDPTLYNRSTWRKKWCEEVYPDVVAGFHTDGDWVAKEEFPKTPGPKLVHLPQGFDERRKFPPGTLGSNGAIPDLVFTGMVHHGQRRASHIQHLRDKYKEAFAVIGEGGPRRRVHGYDLANVYQSARIVIAPDGPTTDRYWSNRVYLTTGMGGFLIHPACRELAKEYEPNNHLFYYESRRQLDDLITKLVDDKKTRDEMAWRGYNRTVERNLYRHRVEKLLQVVNERISSGYSKPR